MLTASSPAIMDVSPSQLRTLDTDLWVADAPFSYLGLRVGTRMTVVRSPDGLLLISPIPLADPLCQQLAELGDVRHLISPNTFHHLYIKSWKARFPSATLWAVPELAAKRPDLTIDHYLPTGSLLNTLDCRPVEGFQTLLPRGVVTIHEAVFFHPSSRTLILTDTAFHFDSEFPWLTRFAAKVMGSYGRLSPSMLERIATRDRQRVRDSMIEILSWDFERIVMAHGTIVESNAKERLRQGYEWFLNESLTASANI